MIKRRLICLAAAAVAVLTVLFGAASCGGNVARIRISVGMLPDFSVSSAETEYYKACIDRFEKDYPQYEIVSSPYVYSSDTVIAKATSGQLPVVFQSYASEVGWLADSGYISPMDRPLAEMNWASAMEDWAAAMLTADGKIYGVPREGSGMGLLINLSILHKAGRIGKNADGYVLSDSAGMPLYPLTFDEVRDCARAVVKQYGDDVKGLVLLSADTYGGRQFENCAWNFGSGDLQSLGEDGAWTSRLNTPACVTAMRWVQDVSRDKLTVTSPAYLSYSDLYDIVGNGRAAMAFCTNLDVGIVLANYGIAREDVAFVPMPAGDGVSRKSVGDGTAYLFSAKATPAQLRGALLFLKYLGRSPETDAAGAEALRRRFAARKSFGQPSIPEIGVWNKREYLSAHAALEKEYADVKNEYYADFFAQFAGMRKTSAPHFRSAMYGLLDEVMQKTLASPNAYNVYTLLTSANGVFQTEYLDRRNR